MNAPALADERPLGLYVHIPFCEQKCTYCHFAIDPGRGDDARQQRYVDAGVAEIQGAAGASGRAPADSLYFVEVPSGRLRLTSREAMLSNEVFRAFV